MTLVRLLFLFLGLSHLRGCVTPLCEALDAYAPKAVVTRTGDQFMIDAVLTSEGDLIVETAMSYTPPEYHHTVVRVNDAYGVQEVKKLKYESYYGSGLVSSGGSWWYSIAGGRTENEQGVLFVSPQVSFVNVGTIYSADWMPFDEASPRGLLVGASGDSLQALDVAPGGVRRRWKLPMVNAFSGGWLQAERLTGGEIAFVSYGGDDRLLLRILVEKTEPEEIVLRDQLQAVRIATALSADGQLAVVVEMRNGELEAAVFDPLNPGTLTWQRLATKEDQGRFPTVVFHEDEFVAAWYSPQRDQLQARPFTAARMGPAATIAPLLRRGNTPVSITIIPAGEELVFAWQEDEVMTRRVPADLAGFELLESLCRRFVEKVI